MHVIVLFSIGIYIVSKFCCIFILCKVTMKVKTTSGFDNESAQLLCFENLH